MECPVCGCPVDAPSDGSVASCDCCGDMWLVAADHRSFDRVLVGSEG